ncbi:putative quinol monooxygenase [Pacificoceanicola onchidii]|uniref:putative quinol monooxygenase n=1 Tax=Pacificoceanicola onchidii TaxID=2562685 RepID=UPI0010A383EC|nr:putative quinol monooxygenase [Pacificoceanicola onchidii]
MPVYLTGTMTCPPERLDAVRAALPAHIALTRAEPGCTRFDVTEDVHTPGQFHVSEEFTNRAAFDAHQIRGASSAWADVTRGLPRDYAIRDTGE